jgi:hypothetical protein
MGALVGPLLVLSGFGLYMATNNLLGRFRRLPWEFVAVSALGVIVACWLALREDGFLLDEQGMIRWIYRPDTYRMRASIDELIAAIDA